MKASSTVFSMCQMLSLVLTSDDVGTTTTPITRLLP